MSWLRTAVNRAVEVGGSNPLTRNLRYAGQAVIATKLFQDRAGSRNLRSFRQAVKRLEEVSIACRGAERVQLLTKWLVALKEIERICNSDNNFDRKPTVILEIPNDQEVSLLLEIFGLCLIGGKDVHEATVGCIQDLSKSFSIYKDEVLAKREELLEFAQAAIAGLKVNPDIVRIDSEVANLYQNMDERSSHTSESDHKSAELGLVTLKEPLAQIQLCSKLESLLLKKKFSHTGDSPDMHTLKVDKLRILAESLRTSASSAEKRISDHRSHKQEALHFRVSKTSEVSQLEKDLQAEISSLEKRKLELEAELKKVNISLKTTRVRLLNAKEERELLDGASNEILEHFKTKEDEQIKNIDSCRAESDACNAFISFLDATWVFQSLYSEQKEKQVNAELDQHEEYFVNLAICLLSAYKDELQSSIINVKKILDKLRGLEIVVGDPRRMLEQEYLDYESKFMATFNVLDGIKELFYTQNFEFTRKGDRKVKELYEDLQKIRNEFEAIERPILDIESESTKKIEPLLPVKALRSLSFGRKLSFKDINDAKSSRLGSPRKSSTPTSKDSPVVSLYQDKQLSKLVLELEHDSRYYTSDDFNDWDFDVIEKEPKLTRSFSRK